MTLSVLIPARNETGNIDATMTALRRRLASEAIDYEVVVVDDGSSDATAGEVLAHCRADSRVRLVENRGPHGFGRAVRLALEHCTGDAIVIVMADGSDDPGDVVQYYGILRDHADCAFGSRWIAGARVHNCPPMKRVVNRLVNHGIRLLFGIGYDDATNAFKGYRRHVIEACRPLRSSHFELTVELPLKALVRGYTYAVVPVSWRNRNAGASSFRLREMGGRYLRTIGRVWMERVSGPQRLR